MTKYWVVGGEYESTEFRVLKAGGKELRAGPFLTYEDALRKWAELAWRSVDSCNIRYRIEIENDAAAA